MAWAPAGLVPGSNSPWGLAHPSSKTETVFLASASCVPWTITYRTDIDEFMLFFWLAQKRKVAPLIHGAFL